MKAIQYIDFGKSDVIQLTNVIKPEPKQGEVMIKVKALSVNPVDIKIRVGSLQDSRPVQLPFTPGLDAAGVVEKVGEGVSRIKVGDRVVATAYNGTYAEYACFSEQHVSIIPVSIDFENAAAASIGLITAYTFLQERGKIGVGTRVLINGAGGGTGTVVLQMAKALGAYVVCVDSYASIKLLKALGADEAIDYKKQVISEVTKNIDLVIDFVGRDSQSECFKVLKKGGQLLSAFSIPSKELAAKYDVESDFVIASLSRENLDYGLQKMDEKKITPIIRKVMPLQRAAAAQDLLSKGGLNGKIILKPAD
jgi:NADPH:quinone reductase-like Zn-dependent oxidoreductase